MPPKNTKRLWEKNNTRSRKYNAHWVPNTPNTPYG